MDDNYIEVNFYLLTKPAKMRWTIFSTMHTILQSDIVKKIKPPEMVRELRTRCHYVFSAKDLLRKKSNAK